MMGTPRNRCQIDVLFQTNNFSNSTSMASLGRSVIVSKKNEQRKICLLLQVSQIHINPEKTLKNHQGANVQGAEVSNSEQKERTKKNMPFITGFTNSHKS